MPEERPMVPGTKATKYAVLLTPAGFFNQITGIQFQIATANDKDGTAIVEAFFKRLEESVLKSESYRGKVLSLETGRAFILRGIRRHHGPQASQRVERTGYPSSENPGTARTQCDPVRPAAGATRGFRQATKKGILFYGPPGTGKTHTLHYLAGALRGHTTLSDLGRTGGVAGEYMTLARLLQPSVVVLEDADLIARERTQDGKPVRGGVAEQAAK